MANLYAKVLSKVWSDPEYKARLKADPIATLAEAGVNVKKGVEIEVHEDTDKLMHVVLPTSPAGETLSEGELEGISAGNVFHDISWSACT